MHSLQEHLCFHGECNCATAAEQPCKDNSGGKKYSYKQNAAYNEYAVDYFFRTRGNAIHLTP